jgi:PIN domain nuclease of toxin-antitoxin system
VRLLLDTHAFLWFLAGHRALSRKARTAIESERNQKYLSVVSVWEMEIKHSLGKLRLGLPLRDAITSGADECGLILLSVNPDHALAVADLPLLHDDPFDRLLIAQARVDALRLVSRDAAFDGYGIPRVW